MLGFKLIFTNGLEKKSPARQKKKKVWKDVNLWDVYKHLERDMEKGKKKRIESPESFRLFENGN